MATPAETQSVIRSLIPARIDRLPWSPFHTRMVIALGVAWILDGLEITVASAVADTLTQPETLGLSSAAVGLVATVYLAGEVVGALFFGRLSDKLGRRNLFMITLGVPTRRPTRVCSVAIADAVRLSQPSKIGWYWSPKIAYRSSQANRWAYPSRSTRRTESM